MKPLRQYFATTALTLLPLLAAAQNAATATCEYWIDGDFDARKSVALTDSWQATLDLSALTTGAHTIGVRVSDSNGLWSAPIVRYFVRPPMYAQGGKPAGYEYWIDDYANRVTGKMQSETLALEIDAQTLATGVHTLALRTHDSNGLWSTPIVRYFVRPPMYAQGGTPAGYEYWIDDYANRVTGKMQNETLALEIDAQTLATGVHTLALRTHDSNGLWSAPIVRYFVHTGEPTPGTLRSYRYWIDNNLESAITGETADGIINLELDFSELGKGVHTLTFQAEDSNGKVSPAICKFFVVTEPIPAENNIVAYEYWFNHGKRTRVEVDPANPLTIENLWIEIEDVVPHSIADDYRFDAVQQTAWCNDNVYFGLQAFDAANRGTVAVLSDTFAMEVPVKLNFIELADGAAQLFDTPQPGHIAAFVAHSAQGDSIEWKIKGNCTAHFYSQTGARLSPEKVSAKGDSVILRTKSESEKTFLLAYNNKPYDKEQEVMFRNLSTTGTDISLTNETKVYAKRGVIFVQTHKPCHVEIYDEQGRLVVEDIPSSTMHYNLPTGTYNVKIDNKTACKVFVR
ncbi:MAG: hypothetical protein IJN24_08645 [Bacteroidaceae bacterium]|nr:hypothetical protein [Bacteroidaceae bacterium]